MKTSLLISVLLVQAASIVTGFSTASGRHGLMKQNILQRPSGFAPYPPSSSLRVASSSSSAQDQAVTGDKQDDGKAKLKKLREHGGMLTFNTPIGALNPFAIYYGLMSLFLGLPWLIALKSCQLLYWITGGRFDKKVRLVCTRFRTTEARISDTASFCNSIYFEFWLRVYSTCCHCFFSETTPSIF